uniref:Reverse transcriptase domain-containing protein n=1 Tax=Tanacetum cinerariifolium TaxID=118510 RepID=A0A6L2KQM1_TANCI|nr:reverse transcriptase domain-containing protein [Tanacetum cinerariifolium]
MGEVYHVKFIVNPNDRDSTPGIVIGRLFLKTLRGIVNLEKGVMSIYPDLDPFHDNSYDSDDPGDEWDDLLENINFGDIPKIDELPPLVCNMGKNYRNKGKIKENYKMTYSDEGPSLNFIVERLKDNPLDTPIEAEEELSDPWTLFTDRSSYVDGSKAGLILTNPKGTEFTYALRFRFISTKNDAENEALIADFRITKQMELKEKSINKAKVLAIMEEKGDTWMTPIYEYLTKETLPMEKEKARDNPFKDWCEKLCIRQRFTSVKHPQANGLVERENKILGEGINARLDERSNDWIEEVPHVLWAHRTMIKSRNKDTPFSLTYKAKAAILVKIGMPTLRIAEIEMVQNDEALEINLDLLEERREQAAIREARRK